MLRWLTFYNTRLVVILSLIMVVCCYIDKVLFSMLFLVFNAQRRGGLFYSWNFIFILIMTKCHSDNLLIALIILTTHRILYTIWLLFERVNFFLQRWIFINEHDVVMILLFEGSKFILCTYIIILQRLIIFFKVLWIDKLILKTESK